MALKEEVGMAPEIEETLASLANCKSLSDSGWWKKGGAAVSPRVRNSYDGILVDSGVRTMIPVSGITCNISALTVDMPQDNRLI